MPVPKELSQHLTITKGGISISLAGIVVAAWTWISNVEDRLELLKTNDTLQTSACIERTHTLDINNAIITTNLEQTMGSLDRIETLLNKSEK